MKFRLRHLLILSTCVCVYLALATRYPFLLSVVGFAVFFTAVALAVPVALAFLGCFAFDFVVRAVADPSERMNALEEELEREAREKRRLANGMRDTP